MSDVLLQLGRGRRFRFSTTTSGAVRVGHEYRDSKRGLIADRPLLIELAELRSVAAVLQRMAVEIEKGLAD